MTATPNLDRLVSLVSDAGGASYGRSADDSFGEEDLDQAHGYLRRDCPWYLKVSAGAPVGDFEQHCQAAHGGQPPRLVVKLTPHTAEASTVDKPTRPPGGPGLFHVKGLHLPPYIQHLWFHLVKEYGEKKAYGVAVGIVKKWKSGINPGGRHPGHVHADVQAAASRNVAQWEEDRAKAHEQSARTEARERSRVRATVALADGPTMTKPEANYRAGGTPGHCCGDCSMASGWKAPDFESGDCSLVRGLIEASYVCDHYEPDRKAAKVALAFSPADGEDPRTTGAVYPGQKQLPLPPVPDHPVAKAMFIAHRVDGTLYHLAHAAQRLLRAKQNPDLRHYHMIHVNNHVNFALGSGHELAADLRANYPAEAAELDAITKTMGLTRSLSRDAKAATFVHLLQTILYDEAHAKRHTIPMLNPDPEDLWQFNFDHAKKHMEGAFQHCFKLAHHIRDNYPDIARWLTDLSKAENPDDPYTGLAGGSQGLHVQLADGGAGGLGGGAVITAPGAMRDFIPPPPGGRYSQYGLHQKPSQTVSPSPPLPPLVKEPTPQEVRDLIPGIPESSDVSLSRSVRDFLENAAVKLEKHDELAALAMLRSAGTAVFAANKADIGQVMPAFYTAGVFSRIPPAEQSSAGQAILEAQEQRQKWRELAMAVQELADRIRKRYFHGQYNGPSQQGRLTDENGMSALDQVLALAQPVVTGQDVSFPTTSDVTQRATLMQPPDIGSLRPQGKAAEDLAALPPLASVRVTTHLASARDAMHVNPLVAAQCLARAEAAARDAGAQHLARWLRESLRALGGGENSTWPEDAAANQPGHGGEHNVQNPYGQVTKLTVALAGVGGAGVGGAGSSAGHSAGAGVGRSKPTGPPTSAGGRPGGPARPDAHQLHELHLQHLRELHADHLQHMEHLHRLHLQHMEHVENRPQAVGATVTRTVARRPGY